MMMADQFYAYITKYALTAGIQYKLVENSHFADMATEVGPWHTHYHGEGKEWHRTFEGAKARAENMRTNKLASMEKSAKKLRSIDFSKDPAL
jgi:hypothetical protein